MTVKRCDLEKNVILYLSWSDNLQIEHYFFCHFYASQGQYALYSFFERCPVLFSFGIEDGLPAFLFSIERGCPSPRTRGAKLKCSNVDLPMID